MTVLVTVKAYPTISDRHGEAVCVAGIRVDVDPPCWVRLFPVPFRDLPPAQRFEKYEFITLVARRDVDTRPESYFPDATSIVRKDRLGTERGWEVRRALIEPLLQPSMCAVRQRRRVDQTSLAVIRPAHVTDFKAGPAKPRTAGQ